MGVRSKLLAEMSKASDPVRCKKAIIHIPFKTHKPPTVVLEEGAAVEPFQIRKNIVFMGGAWMDDGNFDLLCPPLDSF